MTKITAIAAAVVLGCNPPTNPPPTPVQSKTPLKLVYGTDNTIQAVRNKALDSPRPTLTPKGTTAKYSISDAPAWLTVNPDTGVLSAAADKTGALTKGAEFTATVTAAGVGGAYDKETAEAKIRINVVDELTITFNPPAGTAPPSAGEPHVTGTKNTTMEFGGTFTVNPPDPSAAYELDHASDPLPPGLTIDPKTGKITGTPTAPTKGPINIIIRVKDTTAKITLRLQINPDAFPGMYYPLTTTIARGSSTSVALTGAEGVTASYAFDTSGSNPANPSWLNIDSNTGAISVGNAAAPVPETEPFGTTTYKITVTGTGQYAAIPPETLDFSLTVEAAMFPDPLRISYPGLILKKGGTDLERSGTTLSPDSNEPKLTVTYEYAPVPAANTEPKPGWLTINSTTGVIEVDKAANSDLPNVGATKTYKIIITGTGIYQGRTDDINFVISGSALPIPTAIVYPTTNQVEKGKSKIVSLPTHPTFSGTYRFDASSPTKPAWLNINSSTGQITIGPTADDRLAKVPVNAHGATGGEVTYKIKVEGSGNYQGEDTVLDFKLNVVPAPIPTNMSYGATKVVPISSAVTATLTNGIAADYAVPSVTRPGGALSGEPTLVFDTNGDITGPAEVPTTTTPGTYTYTIRVTGRTDTIHQGADPVNVEFTLRVPTPIPTNMSYSAASIARGSAVTATLTNGIDADYTQQTPVAVKDGAVASSAPALTVGANGAITSPTTIAASTPAGTYTYTIRVTGKSNTIYAGAAHVDVTFALTVTPAALPTNMSYSAASIARGSAVTATLTNGIDADYTQQTPVAVKDGAVASSAPALTVGANGAITSPTTIAASTPAGTYTYTIRVTGKSNTIYAGAAHVDVTFALTVTPAVIPDLNYGGATLTMGSTGGTRDISGAPSTGLTYVFAATQPDWLHVNQTTGRISIGTTDTTSSVPANTAGSYSIVVNVNGAANSIYHGAAQKTVTFALTVDPATLPTNMIYAAASVLRGSAVTASLTNGIDANYTQQTPVAVTGGAVASSAPTLTFNTTNGAITGPTIATTTPAGTYTYTIRVTGKTGTIYEGAAHVDVTFALTVTQHLPSSMSYLDRSGSRFVTSNISEPLYSGNSSTTALPNAITAAQADFSVLNTPANAPALTVNNVGRVSLTVNASSVVGNYTYTIRVTGKGIYAGSTRDVTFELSITG